VGAVLAVEDQRKGVGIADAEEHERGEAFAVGRDAAHVDALAPELLADESSEMIVTDARHEPGAQPEPCGADRGVGRAAADVLGEARHVLEPAAALLAVEIDAGAPDRDDVQRWWRGFPHDGSQSPGGDAPRDVKNIPLRSIWQHPFHSGARRRWAEALRRDWLTD